MNSCFFFPLTSSLWMLSVLTPSQGIRSWRGWCRCQPASSSGCDLVGLDERPKLKPKNVSDTNSKFGPFLEACGQQPKGGKKSKFSSFWAPQSPRFWGDSYLLTSQKKLKLTCFCNLHVWSRLKNSIVRLKIAHRLFLGVLESVGHGPHGRGEAWRAHRRGGRQAWRTDQGGDRRGGEDGGQAAQRRRDRQEQEGLRAEEGGLRRRSADQGETREGGLRVRRTNPILWLQKAEAELAYELQAAKTKQRIKDEQMQIRVVERTQEILVQVTRVKLQALVMTSSPVCLSGARDPTKRARAGLYSAEAGRGREVQAGEAGRGQQEQSERT